MEIVFSEFLDIERKNSLFIKFTLSEDGKELMEFVVSHLHTIGSKQREIIRFDCSSNERLHAHRFYLKGGQKQHLNIEISYDALDQCKESIRANWHVYLAKNFENITDKVI